MAEDLPEYIKIVKSKNLKCLCIAMGQGNGDFMKIVDAV